MIVCLHDCVINMGFYDTLVALLYMFICLPMACCGRLSDLLISKELLHDWMIRDVPHWLLTSSLDNPLSNQRSNISLSTLVTQQEVAKMMETLMVVRKRVRSQNEGTKLSKDTLLMPTAKRLHTNSFERATVEILVVVDNSIYRKFLRQHNFQKEEAKKSIVQYFSIVFAMVDERYKTIKDSNFSIRINICDIAIAETRRAAAWVEFLSRWSDSQQNSVVGASRALKRFQKWLRKNRSILSYDHAVLVTSYILSKKGQQVEGLAYMGTMCMTKLGKSTSIVQDSGDFQSVGVIAHELAHSLGVLHDGTRKTKLCPETDNYIMAPHAINDQAAVARNLFRFSKCSIKLIKSFIQSPQSECLKNIPTKHIAYNLDKNPPGELFSVDTQCQKAFGSDAYFCDQNATRKTVCSRLWCVNPSKSTSMCRSGNRLMALPGSKCGVDRHCHLGECVPKSLQVDRIDAKLYSRIKIRDDRCPLGDSDPAYCQSLILASRYICDIRSLREYCCDSCDTLNQ